MPESRIACLSLDGGGIRALSQLMILKTLMEQINPETPPKPCDCFHLIGGSGTGGLIAILLGCLAVGVDECIDLFLEVSRTMSPKENRAVVNLRTARDMLFGNKRYDERPHLDILLQDIIERQALQRDILFKDAQYGCKVIVTAARADSGYPVTFSNFQYEGMNQYLSDLKVWEVARATLAGSTMFEPVKLGPFQDKFVDGSLGGNNPVRNIWVEMNNVWPNNKDQFCMVSVGSGVPMPPVYNGNASHLIRSLVAIATETEQTAEMFAREHVDLLEHHRYFRFNATKLESIGIREYDRVVEIEGNTGSYLCTPEVHLSMSRCAEVLAGHHVPNEGIGPISPITRQESYEVDPLGLTIVHPQDDQATSEFDLVAVHGSTAGSYSTWRHPGTGTSLIHDLLPEDFPNIRILTYGHSLDKIRSANNDQSDHQATLRLFDIASGLLNDLVDKRSRGLSARPLVFLCHGIGGIIVKKALVVANSQASQFGSIPESLKHIIFLDTPHRGYNYGTLRIISDGSMVASSQMWANVLRQLNTEFGGLAERMWFTSFFADLSPCSSTVAGEVSVSVEQDSSVLGFQRERSVMLDNTTHATIGQFSGPLDRSYSRLKDRINSVILMGYPDQAYTVMKGCIRSVSFKIMGDEVIVTHGVLQQLVKTLSTNKLDLDDVEKLRELARQCRDYLSLMNEQLQRYFKRPVSNSEEAEIRHKLEELRNALKYRTALLHRFYMNVMLRTASVTSEQRDILNREILARIEEKIDKLVEHIGRTIVPQPTISSSTPESKTIDPGPELATTKF